MRIELFDAIKQGDTRKFYKSKEWLAKRSQIKIRDNNECQKCKRRGRYSKATCVHHKKHLKDYPELALTDDNLESLCDPCHNEEHPEKLIKKESSKKFINEERWE
ncbi:5-methylcytosine-specific restriction endonuclease McrA [Anaerosolibacter carboniphilus]|uniref:Putative HNH nuclease YajD n=1 Tax=Anaerosolibacter carboniphilus TaxID=1417629 RepID=A0A841KNI8_9FIRM|nr:HNH endonuclease [Anaerosolibacter carboniphilus]MBB6214973.1 5-methylcytosine-specific restriction endonuclease McrA [Anaerosolibacter carboniphilus]